MRAKKVLIGLDNTLEFVPLENCQPITDMEPVTRITVEIGEVLVDSDDHPEAVWWDKVERRGPDGVMEETWVLFLHLGHLEELEDMAGNRYSCPVVFYDSDHPYGIEWYQLVLDIL